MNIRHTDAETSEFANEMRRCFHSGRGSQSGSTRGSKTGVGKWSVFIRRPDGVCTVLTRSGRRMFPDQNRFTEWNHFLNRKWPRIDNQIAPKLPTSSPNRGLGLGHAGVFGCLLRKFAIAYSFKSNICHTTNLLFVCCFTRCCLATADFEAAAFQVCRDCLAG